MEPFFISEKETEDLLQRETRSVRMPDGTLRPITDFKIMWANFDELLSKTSFDEPELVALAITSSEETGRPFEEAFPNLVAYVLRVARERLGI
jgi:hypothetical protein